MKNIMRLISLFMGIFLCQFQVTATDKGGLIGSDETWDVAGSPYIITSTTLINTGVTVTIEPGVIVKCNPGFYIQVAGTLVARGTAESRILFTSNNETPAPGDWNGISFSNASIDAEYDANDDYVSGCIMEYCIIEFAGPGVAANQSGPCIDHCVFIDNFTDVANEAAGLTVSYSDSIRIRNNLFLLNESYAIYGSAGGIFMEMSSKVQILNNVFYGNSARSYNGGGGNAGGAIVLSQNPSGGPYDIAYNTFYKNTARGNDNSSYPHTVGGGLSLQPRDYTVITLDYNTIIDNESYDSEDAGAIVGVVADVSNNNLMNNFPYDVAIYSGNSKAPEYQLDARDNWWNTVVESEIQAKIHDYFDTFGDINEVLYNPWQSSLVLGAPVSPPKQVIKQEKTEGIYVRWKPNPEADIEGYKIYYGSPTGYSYEHFVDVGNDTVYTLTGVSLSDEIAVTAYDQDADGSDDIVEGHESWYAISEEGLAISLEATHVTCKDFTNGSVDLTVTNGFEPFTYAWSNDSTTEDITDLPAGTYEVTVTDAQYFTATASIEVTEPDLLEVAFDVSNVNCIGGSDGEVNLTVSGGTPDYSYSWTGPDFFNQYTEDISGLKEGKYYLTLYDSKSCNLQDSVTIGYDHELPTPVITFADSNKICDGDSLELDAGVGYVGYLWSTTETSQTIQVTETNTYTVTVTDANGCVNSDEQVVTVLPVPTSTFTLDESICEDETNILTYTGTGLPGASYNWELDDGSIVSGTGQGPLTVEWPSIGSKNISLSVVQDGCYSDTTKVAINVYQVPTSTFSMQSTVCSDGLVPVAYLGNATSGADYDWSVDGGTIQSGSGQGPLEINWASGGDKTVTLQVTENECVSGITNHSIYVAYPYEDQEICLVTIDTETGKNMVVWERTADMGIASYNIYRESDVINVYDSISNVPFDQISQFVDMDAIPEQQQYLYKISAVDTCGNESELSQYHKTLFLQYQGADAGVNLGWKLYQIEGTPVSFLSYILYKGSDSTDLEPFDTISGGLDAYTDTDPSVLETRYYYRIAGVLANDCSPADVLKAGSGPYSHSLSNIEDNRLQVDVNHAPTDITLDNNMLDEDQDAGVLVGRFSTTDEDISDTHTYSLVEGEGDSGNSNFTISGDSLISTVSFDFETQASYSIRVQSMDNGTDNLTFEKIFSITINDVIESGIDEISPGGMKIFPNPFDESTTLRFPNPEGERYTLKVFDLTGKMVRTVKNITGTEYILERKDLNKGYYVIRLEGIKTYHGRITVK